ncbi:MAG: M3 family metallopeptidase [Flavobacteriales bacterium]|nr:M3 family metallopeptidase [Flavobacteriales bacterium]
MRPSSDISIIPITCLLLMNTACTSPGSGTTAADIEFDRFVNTGLPYNAPDFNWIRQEYFKPAIEEGMRRQKEEVEAIATNAEAPTFANTIEALEKSGRLLDRASSVMYQLVSARTNGELQKIRAELSPKLAAHADAIAMDERLFARIKALHDQREQLGLDSVEKRLIERRYTGFARGGALLDEAGKKRLKAINEELSKLSTAFSDNVLAETNSGAVVVDDVKRLEGLGEAEIAAAADAAKSKDMEGKWLITLSNTTQQPVLASLKDRVLREQVYKASIARGSQGNAHDNLKGVARQAKLRAERARLLGYEDHAAYVLADEMAGTPKAALDLITGMVPAAVKNAQAEAAKLQAMMDREYARSATNRQAPRLMPWDWDYYAEQVRKAEYELDEAAIKPYLVLDSVLKNGVFHSAEVLFGITFRERADIPVYHPDVRTWEIFDADGMGIGLFYGDFFARDSKQGGAWMSGFVDQSFLLDELPVITNTCNYAKPPAGEPALISWDDVRTLFHEFGHGVHGMLSRVKHPYFSGTNVPRDFVEFPSQFQENFMLEPTVFASYARHYKTNEPMPQALAGKLLASTRFNQGYATTEYLAAALLDLEWHMLPADAPEVADPLAFEAEALMKHGIALDVVPPRYRTPYFSHIWGGGYSAGYYAYLWSEVLEADAYAWMQENGGMTRDNGLHYWGLILANGGSRDGKELYRALTGREPRVEPLLAKRGLR